MKTAIDSKIGFLPIQVKTVGHHTDNKNERPSEYGTPCHIRSPFYFPFVELPFKSSWRMLNIELLTVLRLIQKRVESQTCIILRCSKNITVYYLTRLISQIKENSCNTKAGQNPIYNSHKTLWCRVELRI